MRRPGCVVALAALVIFAAALSRYRTRDYRPVFSRAAGELVEVRDSTGVGPAVDGLQLTEVTLVSDTGLRARVRVRAPGTLTGERFPAALLVGGLETGRKAVDLPAMTGGMILASIDYPYAGPTSPRGWQWARWLLPMRRAVVRTPSVLLLAAQYLYTRGDVDPTRVSVIGVSLGVPFAVAAAATDRRLAGAALLHGGAGVADMAAFAYADRGPPWLIRLLAEAVAWLAAPLEPARYADDIAPRPVLLLNATGDELIPRASVEALYDATRPPRQLVWVETGHVRGTDVEVVQVLLRVTLDWMAEVGLR